MTLALGARLGAYEVLDLIGVGGMGEVYRARDTRLDRTVAIKILPAELSADPDRRARFEREARTISTLNHPHICALYDIGEQDGQAYLVMEHLAGETLAERLDRARGALAFGDALRIGIDIAEALDHAHKHAIVHRDLKPGNVMLTQAGAKLLDFGLAKLQASQAITLVPDSSVVTRSHHLTVAGTIVGTVPYMAPEQIEGREADARTDVWAFGCVLYEMLTGQRAFKGETPGSLVGAILSKEPAPLTSLQPLVPPSLERLVARCLAKEPDERWDSTHDIASELRWLAQDARAGSGVGARGGIPGGRSARRRLAWVALGLAIGAGVTAGLFQLTERQNAGSRGVVRFSIEVPPSRELGPIAFSPTGDRLAYVGTENGLRQIWVRRFDRSEDEALRGTAGADSPFFSPDGKWIGFFADDRLKKILADGGEVVTICSAKIESGGVIGGTATWIRDDTIVFSRGMTGLSRVLATGGTATPLTTLDAAKGELGHSWPEVLPEGQGTLYTVVTGGALDQYHVAALSPSAGRREGSQVVGVASRYVGNGHVVYAQQGQLLALRYDATRLEPVSTPVVVVDNVGFRDRAGTGSVIHVQPLYAVSRMGDLAYASASPPPTGVLVRLDRAGGKKAVAELPRGVRGALSLSPDGRRLALYHGQAGGFTLWMVDVERAVSTRVLAEGNPHAPVWSPDGERLAVSLDRGGTSNLSSLAADGTGKRVLLWNSAQHGDPGSWSRDGRWIAYVEANPSTDWDLRVLDLATRKVHPFRQTPAVERQPTISPDGRWMAYASNESGRSQVFIEAFPEGGKRLQVSLEGGTEPLWGQAGRELLFRAGQGLFSVKVSGAAVLTVTRPTLILEGPYLTASTYGPPGYAVSPDGRFFYTIEPKPGPTVARRIHVVLGWLEEFASSQRGS